MFNSNSMVLNEMKPKRRKTFLSVLSLGIIIIAILFGYHVFGNSKSQNITLLQTHILFRHGEKTPSSTYPTDIHYNYTWVDGLGALTKKGKQGMYKLGKTLKQRYQGFLNDFYSPDELFVKSSYAARCQMSAMVLLAALYPPIGHQVWNEDLLWQPIPINSIPRNVDNMIAAKAPCKAFKAEKEKSDKELHAGLTDKEQELFSYLSIHTNLSVNNIEKVETLYSILKIEDENGLSIPDWAKSIFPEPMKTFAGMNLATYTRTPLLKRLQGGPLLKEWLDHMKNGQRGAFLYAGHDLTLVNLMRTVGISSFPNNPDYGAAFILEVHEMSGKKIVKAFYYNSSWDSEPINLLLPCEQQAYCTLESFISSVSDSIPDDWEKECETSLVR